MTTTWRTSHTPARSRSRRVKASEEVRPRTPRYGGPTMTTAAVANDASGDANATPAAASATTAMGRANGRLLHQRQAKREVDPGR